MNYPLTSRFPCSVCGLDTFQHYGWFLVVENRWMDRLKILSWHPSLAAQRDIKSACCRQHLKALIGHWLNQASLRLPPSDDQPRPIAGTPARPDTDLDPLMVGRLVGELSVHRDAFSRGWTGSPATLECILDALIPQRGGDETYAVEFQPYSPPHESPHGLALH
jgi:hypothetical protein